MCNSFDTMFNGFVFLSPFLGVCVCVCPGASVRGYDDTPGDHSPADAADPPAAGPEPSAAPGPPAAAAGPHVATGTRSYTKHTHTHTPMRAHAQTRTLTHLHTLHS